FPTAFAVYKMEDWAFSLGFGPNSGGGSAEFERGLPSFEIPITKVVPALTPLAQLNPAWAVSGYDADLSFKGSSVYWGIQLGATYQLSDVFSIYGGLRYLPAKNSYQGSIQNIQLKAAGEMVAAPSWLMDVSQAIGGLSATAGGAAQNLSPIIDAGAGTFTLAELEQAGQIDAASRVAIEQGLENFGVSSPDQMTINQIQQVFLGAETQLAGTAASLNTTAGQLTDKEVDTEQTGAGFTPMIGLNISPSENLNIALKYEMKTNLTLKNDTEVDDLGLFPDEAESQNDIPAIFAAGVGYRAAGWLEAQLSYNLYFDKGVDWGPNIRDLAAWEDVNPEKIRTREIDNNYYELGLGLQFNLSEYFAFSVGGLRSAAGIAESWQSDFSFSNPSYTAGAGIMYKITDNLTLDAGFSNTFYEERTVTFEDPHIGPYTETYDKSTFNIAVGLSYSIF
ncbi:MAG: outer membrane beta-barrel protein, partial [Prolixibacteraceae bacterium]